MITLGFALAVPDDTANSAAIPLVRGTDRLEAVVMLLAVTVSLLIIRSPPQPGTAVHDSRSRLCHQAQTPAIPQPRP